ncbi:MULTISPECIES: hypothetical protein [Pseudoalteromonas]|uniref:hypothetical protein n=1 Tax=Pseudoalteromonas TaxID=53246 RepID=UPI001581DD98|nr:MULTISPECIES: hypothetical protein [Pseudoalteromonas]MDI4652076.1 hypothetical protein [Pseudoalteromonas shioyasakiensis]NUJ38401.1 hypothetical protein [Pseudoalteromonas sp. 0303]
MKKLLKSTLVAASVAAVCGVQAADFNDLTTTYSKQGTVSVGKITTSQAVKLQLEKEYANGDLLTFSLSGGALPDSFVNFPSTVTAYVGSVGASNSVTFGLLSGGSEAIYRVTNVDTSFSENGVSSAKATFGTLNVDGAAVVALDAGQTIKIKSIARANGIADVIGEFDPGEQAIAEVKDQILDVTTGPVRFDAVIDVTQMRQLFTGGATDTLVINHPQIPEATLDTWVNKVTEQDVTLTIKGDFTGLTSSQFTSVYGATPTLSAAKDALTLTYGPDFTTDTIEFTSLDNVSLESQTFFIDGVQEYVDSKSDTVEETVASDLYAGEWELNGANINLPYVPYDNVQKAVTERKLQQIIYVTNHGMQAGDVFVTAIGEDGKVWLDNVMLTSIGPKEMVKVAGLMTAALQAEGFDSGKLSVDIVVNAPDEDISVYAAYKHKEELDRGVIINDQYKGKEGNNNLR